MATVNESAKIQAAVIAGQSREMDVAAGRVLRSVRGVALRHVDTGNYISKLSIVSVRGVSGTGRQVTDRLVVADDVAAAAIEGGHITRVAGARRVKWTPGLNIMRRGMDAA